MKRLIRLMSAGLAIGAVPSISFADAVYVGGNTLGEIQQFATNGVMTVFGIDSIANPVGMAFDGAGNLYVANYTANSIAKISTNGFCTLFAVDPGNGSVLNTPQGLAFDHAGDLYVANVAGFGSDFIEKFAPNGSHTTFATDDGSGNVLNQPLGLAFDSAGNLYVGNDAGFGSDFIEKFATDGTSTNFATDPGDGSVLDTPQGLTFDSAGNLYAANGIEPGTIEKFTPGGTPSTFATNGLYYPGGMASDNAGNLYVANQNPGFYTSTIIEYQTNGSGSIFGTNLAGPYALCFDNASNLFVGDLNVIREFTTNGVNSIFTWGSVSNPEGLAFDAAGNLYVANNFTLTVEKITSNGIASVYGTTSGSPYGLGCDSGGNLYVAESSANAILKFAPNGSSSIFASDPGDLSVMSFPEALAIDGAGNVYVENYNTNTIEKFTPSGTPSVFASTGLNGPFGPALAIDKAGNLYAEAPDVGPADFSIVKFAPDGTSTSFARDPGNGSILWGPVAMTFDSAGNLYVVNSGSERIEKFTTNGTPSLFVLADATCIAIQPGLSIAAPPPALFITRLGTNAILSWPIAAGNFYLQATPTLKAPSWTTFSNVTPATVGTNFVETNGVSGAAQFFRLTNY